MRALFFLVTLFWSITALAVNDWDYAGCTSGNQVGDTSTICFDVDQNISSTVAKFRVNASQAIACWDPDVAQLARPAAPGTALIYSCQSSPQGSSTAVCGIQACATISCTLDGTNGVPASQQMCVQLGRGSYIASFPVAPQPGVVGVFSVQGGGQ